MEILKLRKAGSEKSAENHQGLWPLFYLSHFLDVNVKRMRARMESSIRTGMKEESISISSNAMNASPKISGIRTSAMPVPFRNSEVSGRNTFKLFFLTIRTDAVISNAIRAR